MTALLDAALGYIAKGYRVIPIQHGRKNPAHDDWPSLAVTAESARAYFNGTAGNIGAVMGHGDLADGDLDCPEAISAAPFLLPRTATFGHSSKPVSHYIYRCLGLAEAETVAARKWKDPKTGGGLIELRSGGGGRAAQTVFPPSTHPSGEPIQWVDDREPSVALPDVLLVACNRLAAVALLARYYPKDGARHDASRDLGGFLAGCGIDTPTIGVIAEAIGKAGGQPRDKIQDMHRTAEDGAAKMDHRAGFPRMAETFGPDVAKAVADWLGYKGARGNGDDREKFLGGETRWDGEGSAKTPPKQFELIPFERINFDGKEEWRVKGLLPRQGVASFFGAKSSLKSFLAQDCLFHISAGWNWAGRRTIQCEAVYIAAEGAAGLRKRKAGFELYHGDRLPERVPFFMISAAPNLGSGTGDLDALIACMKGRSPGVIAIDTAAQTLGSADENGTGMIQLIANAQALSERLGCLVLLIHHAGLTDTDRLRGHSSLGCALDALVYFERRKGTTTCVMAVQKLKDEDDTGLAFDAELVRVVIGKDEDGDDISTLVVETVRKAEAVAAKATKAAPRAQRLLMDVITAAIDEAGVPIRPFHDGPVVRAVKDGIARERYYARIAEPADDEDMGKATERKRRAWNRAVKAALDAKELIAAEIGEVRHLWKP